MNATALSDTTPAPSVRAWRKRARRARRQHHDRSARDVFTDLYTLLWFLLIYGGALYSEVSRHLRTPGAVEGALERHWLGVAALLAGAGLAWRGLRTLGPMMASPAEQYWALSAPLSRGRWLAPRFGVVVAAGAMTGAVAAAVVVFLGIRGGGTGTAALAGAAFGMAIPAAGTVAQGARPGRRWPAWLGAAPMTGGAVLAGAVIVIHYVGGSLPGAPRAGAPALLAVGAPLALACLWAGVRTLPRLDRAGLSGGAQVAAAVVTSAVWMDPTVLGGVLEVRKWRRVGRVRSRRMRRAVPGIPDRMAALLRAEWVRTTRRPGALAVFAALALAQYAVAVAAPSLAGVTRILLAYLAAGRLMAGLRTVARSTGLRRSLGGGEAAVRAAHVAVPALATALWWAATQPTSGGPQGLGVLLLAGIIGAAYRSATRGPIRHGGAVLDVGMGLLPVDLIVQLARGPDALGVVILLQVLLG